MGRVDVVQVASVADDATAVAFRLLSAFSNECAPETQPVIPSRNEPEAVLEVKW